MKKLFMFLLLFGPISLLGCNESPSSSHNTTNPTSNSQQKQDEEQQQANDNAVQEIINMTIINN